MAATLETSIQNTKAHSSRGGILESGCACLMCVEFNLRKPNIPVQKGLLVLEVRIGQVKIHSLKVLFFYFFFLLSYRQLISITIIGNIHKMKLIWVRLK